MNWPALIVFILLFTLVTVLGFVAARWRRGDLNHLNEWGLAGRRFGTLVTWFLLGGIFTPLTPSWRCRRWCCAGAIGFFALPNTLMVYPFVYVVFPRLWSVSQSMVNATASDFVRGRYDSGLLALVVAATGKIGHHAVYCLQLVGIQAVIAAMGFTGTGLIGDLPLIIAFVILAAFTYTSGLRAPALIAIVKDLLIYIVIIAAVIVHSHTAWRLRAYLCQYSGG